MHSDICLTVSFFHCSILDCQIKVLYDIFYHKTNSKNYGDIGSFFYINRKSYKEEIKEIYGKNSRSGKKGLIKLFKLEGNDKSDKGDVVGYFDGDFAKNDWQVGDKVIVSDATVCDPG